MKTALPPLLHDDTVILILGTMPGEKSIALQQYYGNRGNHFWKILFTVLEETFSTDYHTRKALLKKHKIGLWNVLSHCERTGSQDSKISNEHPNDFTALYSKFPNVRHVFFESKAAARFYAKYTFKAERITYKTLPSTSGLNAGMTYAEKIAGWRQIRSILSTP